MGGKTNTLKMIEEHRGKLETWVRAKTTPQRVVFRAQICLLAAEGLSATEIARRMNTSRPTVFVWKRRFEEEGPEGLTKDAPRGPSPRRLEEATRQAIIEATVNTSPPGGRNWTTRAMAEAFGVSNATVARIWHEMGIVPANQKRKDRKRPRERAKSARFFELVGAFVAPRVRVLAVAVAAIPVTGTRSLADSEVAPRTNLGNCANPRADGGCGPCLAAALCLLDSMVRANVSRDQVIVPDGLPAFLARVGNSTPKSSELHIFLEETETEIRSAVERWAGRIADARIHELPSGSFAASGIQDRVMAGSGARQALAGSQGIPCLVAAVDDFVRLGSDREPFAWVKEAPSIPEGPAICRAVLETMRYLGTLVSSLSRYRATRPRFIRTHEEEPMSWKQKLESWFAAAAFAEEGEHETAMRIAGTPIPDGDQPVTILPPLTTTFAAVAFAEEGCPEYAEEILYGNRKRRSFLQVAGLEHVRVWYGTAPFEQSFAEAVGLAGARYRLLTIQM